MLLGMKDIISDSVSSHLQVNQILCLEHQSGNLYGEAIQLIRDRQLCWFRPLCLVVAKNTRSSWGEDNRIFSQQAIDLADYQAQDILLIDLQSGSDLLWPESLFRPALDTEIISLLPQLRDVEGNSPGKRDNQKCLNKFVHLVWQSYQDRF